MASDSDAVVVGGAVVGGQMVPVNPENGGGMTSDSSFALERELSYIVS